MPSRWVFISQTPIYQLPPKEGSEGLLFQDFRGFSGDSGSGKSCHYNIYIYIYICVYIYVYYMYNYMDCGSSSRADKQKQTSCPQLRFISTFTVTIYYYLLLFITILVTLFYYLLLFIVKQQLWRHCIFLSIEYFAWIYAKAEIFYSVPSTKNNSMGIQMQIIHLFLDFILDLNWRSVKKLYHMVVLRVLLYGTDV